MNEGKALQQCLPKHSDSPEDENSPARSFTNLMFEGKIKSALQLLCSRGKGGVLHPNDTITSSNDDLLSVMEVLKSKHPPGQPASATALQQQGQETFDIHPIVFECLDAAMIKSAAIRTTGAAGPSGLDVKNWRRLCIAFKAASKDLCHSLAMMARRLSTTYVDPAGLSPFLACRLIALDK